MSAIADSDTDILKTTPAEQDIIDTHIDPLSPEEALAHLKADLQIAIEIELATIPIYLYTYYSINRKYQSGLKMDAESLYANKAGGVIMSVAVEEMLHMSLSSNILYALGCEPQLYMRSPGPPNKTTEPPGPPAHFPVNLPYHKPIGPNGKRVAIPLSKLSYHHFWHFLEIEYPSPVGAPPQDRNWATIGQFYDWIRSLIKSGKISDKDFRGPVKLQIQHYNYSPNNIDTVNPLGEFDPWGIPPAQPKKGAPPPCGRTNPPSAAQAADYSNQPDSHEGEYPLITISNRVDALNAIGTICDQGEGYDHTKFDDTRDQEESHYYKFLSLQAQLEDYRDREEPIPRIPPAPDPIEPTITNDDLGKVIYNFPENPITRADQWTTEENHVYSGQYRALSDLCNGVYQYMLILTETIFKVPDPQQKKFFNQAMHESMIWILDKLVRAMRRIDIGGGYVLAPTFENYFLGPRKCAYANLVQLTREITDPAQLEAVSYLFDRIIGLPDVSAYWQDQDF